MPAATAEHAIRLRRAGRARRQPRSCSRIRTSTALPLGRLNSWPCERLLEQRDAARRAPARGRPPPADRDRRRERHREQRRDEPVSGFPQRARRLQVEQTISATAINKSTRSRRSIRPAAAVGERAHRTAPGEQRDPSPHDETAARRRPGLDAAAVQRGPLAHAGDPVPARRRWRLAGPRPSSITSSSSASRPPADVHLGAGGAGVLDRVRERLLDDAVGAQARAPARPRPARPRPADRRWQPGRARARHELRRDPRARAAAPARGGSLAVAEHAEQPAHLRQRLAPGALDRRAATPRRAPARGPSRSGRRPPGSPSPTRCGRSRRGSRARAAPARRARPRARAARARQSSRSARSRAASSRCSASRRARPTIHGSTTNARTPNSAPSRLDDLLSEVAIPSAAEIPSPSSAWRPSRNAPAP